MKKGEWVKTASSNINQVKYDTNTRVLSIEYFNNAIYDYENVPPEVYAELLASDSIGSYVARNIKDQYDYTKQG